MRNQGHAFFVLSVAAWAVLAGACNGGGGTAEDADAPGDPDATVDDAAAVDQGPAEGGTRTPRTASRSM